MSIPCWSRLAGKRATGCPRVAPVRRWSVMPGRDEAEAVREAVAILKQASMAPLDVTGYGTLQERLAEGQEIGDDERTLMDRALAENAVIIAQMQTFSNDDAAPRRGD